MQGQGEPPANGIGTNGHLYIEISVDDHPWFERSDTDLLMALPVGFGDLVQGRKFSIPHLDGKNLDIVVRPSTRPGETIDIPGRGIARARGRGRGDVTVLIKLHVPKKISRSDLSVLESLSDVLNLPDDAVVDFIRSEADDRRNDRG
jgi:molecular chaperone DnaJ